MRTEAGSGGAATLLGADDCRADGHGPARVEPIEGEGETLPAGAAPAGGAAPGLERTGAARLPERGRPEAIELDFRGEAGFAYAGQTLSVLEGLAIGRPILHRNGYVPWDLLALASTRGIRYTILSDRPHDVRILMWRHVHAERQRHWPELRERIR